MPRGRKSRLLSRKSHSHPLDPGETSSVALASPVENTAATPFSPQAPNHANSSPVALMIATPSSNSLPSSSTTPHSSSSTSNPPDGDPKSDKYSGIAIDNIALALEVADKLAGFVKAVPFIGTASSILSQIVKACREVKDTKDKRHDLIVRVRDITSDLCAAILRMETTNHVDLITRLKPDIETYASLLSKTLAAVTEYDKFGAVRVFAAPNQLGNRLSTLQQELDKFGMRFRTNRLVDLAIQQRAMKSSLDEVHDMAIEEKFEKWLGPPPNQKEKHHETQKLREEGTGTWLLNSDKFIRWQDNAGSLWLWGRSGSGKSVLASTVITKLTEDQQTCKELGGPVAIAFFYFDFTNKEAHFVEVALRRIVLQLSAQSPHPYRALKKRYMLMRGQTLPTFNELKHVLQELLSELGRTYIILDALDECRDTEVEQLLTLVSFLQGWTNRSLHLFITSQPRQHLSDFPCGESHIYLWRDRPEDDIQSFVRKELGKKHKLKRWVPRADEVVKQIVDKSNGIFRVAACLLLALSRSQWPKTLDETLRQLPDDLFGVYDRFLKAIIPEHFIYVVGVLRWLLFSRQRLTLRQLADAIAFDFSDPAHYIYVPNNDINENVTAILGWLEGLVALTIVFGGDSSGQLHIALAHASVKDYLLSPHFTQTFCFDLNLGPSHTFIAQSCLGYLIHFADHPLNPTTFPKYHLAFYAAKNWYHHFWLCPDRTSLFPDLLRLLENGSSQCLALNNLRLCGPESALSGKLRCLPMAPPSLYMYSQEGYEVIVRLLLMHGANINEQTPEFGHALQTASGRGHIDVVRLLLDMGADINAPGGRCPLCFLRAGSDSLEDPGLLWEHSEDFNEERGEYGNALSAASGGGYTDVVRLLLENGAAVNAHGGLVCECFSEFMPANRYPTALQAAAGGGHTEVVHLLIENGADVDAEGGVLGFALQNASSEGTTGIVKVLLEHGAKVNSQGGYYGNALQAASCEGSTENIQLLLNHGAAINAQGGYFGNALQAACYHGNTQAARLLISNGAEVNAKGGRYGCALQAAFSARKYNLHKVRGQLHVQELLARGVNMSAQRGGVRWWWKTVSTYKPYTTEMARLLLENHADVNVQGGKFGNALQAAAKGGESEIVRLLINAGADVNAEGGKYGTALQAACSGGVKEIVQLLIDSGADVNIQGGKFGSTLTVAISKGHKEIASLLLDKGAVPTSLVIAVGIQLT